jgi:hypothetical protein
MLAPDARNPRTATMILVVTNDQNVFATCRRTAQSRVSHRKLALSRVVKVQAPPKQGTFTTKYKK